MPFFAPLQPSPPTPSNPHGVADCGTCGAPNKFHADYCTTCNFPMPTCPGKDQDQDKCKS